MVTKKIFFKIAPIIIKENNWEWDCDFPIKKKKKKDEENEER